MVLPRGSASGIRLAFVLAFAARVVADPLPVPAGTKSVVFDGVRLRLAPLDVPMGFVAVRLHVPRGTHLVQWDGDASRLHVAVAHPADDYRGVRDALDMTADRGRAALAARFAEDPGLVADGAANHLLGRWHDAKGDRDAARRWYCRAVLADPGFAPSHLGLALLAAVAGQKPEAARELALARELDLGGGFGLAGALGRAARAHRIELDPAPTLTAAQYALGPDEALDELDQRMIRFHRGIAIHCSPGLERAKLESNLGLFLDGAGKRMRARASYARALGELAGEPASRARSDAAATIYANLARSSAASGWTAEAADYAAMRDHAREVK